MAGSLAQTKTYYVGPQDGWFQILDSTGSAPMFQLQIRAQPHMDQFSFYAGTTAPTTATPAVTSIITSALRETNLIPLGVAPTTAQQTEAFGLLSTIVAGVLGNEAGENMTPMPLGQDNIVSPTGYPWWDNELPGNIFIQTNTRIMCNLTGPGFINLHPRPHDGARLGIVDVSGNFAENPLTIYGNGRNIDGSPEETFSTNGLVQEWIYREDLGGWVTVIPISLTGLMPWPPEFDDMFIIMLAMRLNPRYGQVMHPASEAALKAAMTKFSARYKQSDSQQPAEDGLLYLTNYYRFYGRFANRQYGDPADYFNSGFPY
ncbi:unnamed protein product [Sphagnum compactum]